MNTKIIAFAMAFAAGTLLAGEATVTNVVVQQRWPWSQKVDIDFVLDCDDGEAYDIAVTLKNGDTTIADTQSNGDAFAGDLYGIARGSHRLTLDPSKVESLAGMTFTSVNATVVATRVAMYKVFDLDTGACTDVYESDFAAGLMGSCETNPVPGVESLVWTAVTNASGPYVDYATTKMLLRRIDPGTFHMGTNATQGSTAKYYGLPITVTHSKPYYIGVFEVTQAQYQKIKSSNPSEFTLNGTRRPVEHLKFTDVRGTSANWPEDGFGSADANSFLGLLSSKTGRTFDLPTYAQWKYAAMAGTETDYSDGIAGHPSSVSYNDRMAAIARYGGASGNAGIAFSNVGKSGYPTAAECDTDKATAPVGSYRPNAWGLYDTTGNAWEFVQDYYVAPVQFVEFYDNQTDPVGPTSGTQRWRIGGFWGQDALMLRSEWTGYDVNPTAADTAHRSTGFRVVMIP